MTRPDSPPRRPVPTFDREDRLLAAGRGPVCGIDEAGRGPLAGPVVAAAVVLDPRAVPRGLADSKALSPARREALFEEILARAEVGIAAVSAATIDRTDIRQATLLAMRRAVMALPSAPAFALVDGNDPPALPCGIEAVVKGDAQVASIAAASIVAKVARDRLMARLDRSYPLYGFARHAGYGTAAHLDALRRWGPCPAHRTTFGPVRACLAAGG